MAINEGFSDVKLNDSVTHHASRFLMTRFR